LSEPGAVSDRVSSHGKFNPDESTKVQGKNMLRAPKARNIEVYFAPSALTSLGLREPEALKTESGTLLDIVVNTSDAIVYIYRPKKMMGRALNPSVFVDDTELVRMDNGRYFALKVKPGKHIVHIRGDKKGYAIVMGPGQTYYFRIGLEAGM